MFVDESRVDPAPLRGAGSGSPLFHPGLEDLLERLGIGTEAPPDERAWSELLQILDGMHRELDDLRAAESDLIRERSSYENLFRIAPVPLMQQDYTLVEKWMRELKQRGVLSLRSYIDDDIERIREIAPLIRMTAANPAAQRAVGLPQEEMLGPIEPKIVNPGSEPSWIAQLSAVWDRRPVAHAAFTAITAGGKTYDAESLLAAPMVDGEPDFSRAVLTIIDVTPHRNERRRMEELIEAKDRFLASVSHELRTPLTAILGFARLLEEGGLGEEDTEVMIGSIAQHAQELSDIVEDLLVAARAESSQVNVTPERVDVIEQTRGLLAAAGTFEGMAELHTREETALALADPSRLRQILRNLLTNAERYGGERVRVHVRTNGRSVILDVADDGNGLPADQWERIFEPYHRVHTSPGLPGSVGIGLAISRQLTELMGGSLDYRYERGWSVFRLELPRADG